MKVINYLNLEVNEVEFNQLTVEQAASLILVDIELQQLNQSVPAVVKMTPYLMKFDLPRLRYSWENSNGGFLFCNNGFDEVTVEMNKLTGPRISTAHSIVGLMVTYPKLVPSAINVINSIADSLNYKTNMRIAVKRQLIPLFQELCSDEIAAFMQMSVDNAGMCD